MQIFISSKKSNKSTSQKYIPMTEWNKMQASDNNVEQNSMIPSKVLVIENITVTLEENLSGDFKFKVSSVFATLQDGTIIDSDISAKEPIAFDEDISKEKLKSIIRRCGVLEKYNSYFINDPDIIINSYTLNVKKDYTFFDEFKEGVLIAEDIFE